MKKIKDGTTGPFAEGDPVLYIPDDLLYGPKDEMEKEENLGIVNSKNGIAPTDKIFTIKLNVADINEMTSCIFSFPLFDDQNCLYCSMLAFGIL